MVRMHLYLQGSSKRPSSWQSLMTPFTFLLLFVIFITRCNGLAAEALGPENDQKTDNQTAGRFDAIFSFGDSLNDTGNFKTSQRKPNNYAFEKLPYGITYFGHSTGRF